jgi:hypothetical protein
VTEGLKCGGGRSPSRTRSTCAARVTLRRCGPPPCWQRRSSAGSESRPSLPSTRRLQRGRTAPAQGSSTLSLRGAPSAPLPLCKRLSHRERAGRAGRSSPSRTRAGIRGTGSPTTPTALSPAPSFKELARAGMWGGEQCNEMRDKCAFTIYSTLMNSYYRLPRRFLHQSEKAVSRGWSRGAWGWTRRARWRRAQCRACRTRGSPKPGFPWQVPPRRLCRRTRWLCMWVEVGEGMRRGPPSWGPSARRPAWPRSPPVQHTHARRVREMHWVVVRGGRVYDTAV